MHKNSKLVARNFKNVLGKVRMRDVFDFKKIL